MKLIILKFHIFYTYFTIRKILEVNKKQNKNLKQIRIIYSLTGKLQDKGNKPKRACPPTDEEINILYNRNVLGSHTPQSLINTLIWWQLVKAVTRARVRFQKPGPKFVFSLLHQC